MKYMTAFMAAHPPTTKEIKERRSKAKRERARDNADVESIKMKIVKGILSLVMPNGKALANCTGTECVTFGGWFRRIGERVGPTKKVGDVFSEADLKKL